MFFPTSQGSSASRLLAKDPLNISLIGPYSHIDLSFAPFAEVSRTLIFNGLKWFLGFCVAAMCPSDLQQLWKEVSGVPSSEEALKQAEGLDLSTNSSNSTSAFPKAASTHIALHSLANGQSHTPKRDRYVPRFADNPHRDDVFVLCGTGTRTLPSGRFFRAFNSTRAHRNTAALHVALHPGANGSRAFGFGPVWQDASGCLQKGEWRQQAAACKPWSLTWRQSETGD